MQPEEWVADKFFVPAAEDIELNGRWEHAPQRQINNRERIFGEMMLRKGWGEGVLTEAM